MQTSEPGRSGGLIWGRGASAWPPRTLAVAALVGAWLAAALLLGYVPAAALLLAFLLGVLYGGRGGSRPHPRTPGGEKQLLLALRDLGALTPVEAALETSLSLDEAERALTSLADRGHVGVESRDGVLVYGLPRRPG